MKLFHAIILLASLFGPLAKAEDVSEAPLLPSFPPAERADCVLNHSDPYDPGIVMHSGEFSGECADTSGFRAPYIIEENDQTITVANLRHGDRPWIATTPKNEIEKVYYQESLFRGIIPGAHVLLFFAMKPGHFITLRPQLPELSGTIQLNGFLVSGDPFTAVGRSSSISLGAYFDGDWQMVTSLFSESQRVLHEVVLDESKKVERIPLDLSPEQVVHLADVAIRRSAREVYSNIYHTFRNNCVHAIFSILDEAFPSQKKVPDVSVHWWTFFRPVVGRSEYALRARRLITRQSVRIDMARELAEGRVYALEETLAALPTEEERANLLRNVQKVEEKRLRRRRHR